MRRCGQDMKDWLIRRCIESMLTESAERAFWDGHLKQSEQHFLEGKVSSIFWKAFGKVGG